MKLTIVGDPHCKPSNLNKITQLFQEVEALGNPVVWLGDMLDTKEVIHGKCLNLWYDLITRSRLNHTILVGNHDWFSSQEQDHSLRLLHIPGKCYVIDKFFIEGNISFFPYSSNIEETRSYLNIADTPFVIGHFDIQGFDYGNGIDSKEGLVTEDFKHFDRVISGHYHKYQMTHNIMYLGTPFSHSFGESNQEKYLAVFDTDTGQTELVPMGFPKHLTHEIDCNKLYIQSEGRRASKFSFSEKDYHRVILSGSYENVLKFPNDDYPHVKFIEQPISYNSNEMLSEALTNEQKFVKWALDIKKLKDPIVNKGVKLLKDV